MKFLCLPGGYCSATALKTQLGPFCDALASNGNASFLYTQGTTEVHVPPEFAGFFGPPPNYTFIKVDGPALVHTNMRDFPKRNTPEEAMKAATQAAGDPTFSCITEVMDRLVGILDSEGDIDGVIGFSEGAQIAASLILEEQRREIELGRIPRLKCAILFSGWPPVHPVSGKVVTADDYNEEPITIPTCHVVGASDPFLDGSMALYNMCDPDSADLFDHGAGHLIPRKKQTAEEIALVVREMINCTACSI
ncbi:Serine hydrolase FSH [Penicillium cf. griseofulvum]|uniref:Serine hydrolase FSH n=1 Tax=Penicillium cf. griseofulvum TaxID=2972120 RepID=A0A9W9M2V9_9EURO|nr:Serine hydrolase FSH [Penicillium cf. griseofulvum]KAJ5429724.1 Serine hydrolase FSH [Penicillium cf. griseofulvum]KAJ5436508.1 Serine hydrolase FSH [Penicillium cf. griseofulvum]